MHACFFIKSNQCTYVDICTNILYVIHMYFTIYGKIQADIVYVCTSMYMYVQVRMYTTHEMHRYIHSSYALSLTIDCDQSPVQNRDLL